MTDAELPRTRDEDLESWVLIKAVLTSWLQSQSHIGSTEEGIAAVVAAETMDYYRSLGALIADVREDVDGRLGVTLGNLVRLAGGGVQLYQMNHNASVPHDRWLTESEVLESFVKNILNNPDAQPPA